MPKFITEERIQITQAVMQLLDDWNISASHIITLLGLPGKTRTRHLERFRNSIPLPNDPAVMRRVEHLAGIADALRTTFPRNSTMGSIWLRKPHRRSKNHAPLDIMIRDINGLIAIRAELDCAYAWQRSEKNS